MDNVRSPNRFLDETFLKKDGIPLYLKDENAE